jgi:hypothetical protein
VLCPGKRTKVLLGIQPPLNEAMVLFDEIVVLMRTPPLASGRQHALPLQGAHCDRRSSELSAGYWSSLDGQLPST